MRIDLEGKVDLIIRSVPRDENGAKYEFTDNNGEKNGFSKDPDISSKMINMLADPLGGLLIPDFKTRKKYFSIRTTSYRIVWDYKMKSNPQNN